MHGLTDCAWGWIIVENLAVTKPAKEFLHILCIPKYHYHVHKLFTTSCPVPSLIQYTLSHPFFYRFILILSFHLCLCLQSGLFTLGVLSICQVLLNS